MLSNDQKYDFKNIPPSLIYRMSPGAQNEESFDSEVPQHKPQCHKKTRQALRNAVKECGDDDWDGYDAKGMNWNSHEESLRFLDILPDTIPTPDVAVEPDGMVAFEWYEEPRWVFSVSFETNGAIAYAGLFGNSKTHGAEYFGEEVPQTILDNICRVYSRKS